jgi:hypothetical protein
VFERWLRLLWSVIPNMWLMSIGVKDGVKLGFRRTKGLHVESDDGSESTWSKPETTPTLTLRYSAINRVCECPRGRKRRLHSSWAALNGIRLFNNKYVR